MNKENASKLWKMIQEAGDYLRAQRFAPTHIKSNLSLQIERKTIVKVDYEQKIQEYELDHEAINQTRILQMM